MSKTDIGSWADFSLINMSYRRWQFDAELEARYRADFVKLVAALRVRAQMVTLPLWLAFILTDYISAFLAPDYGAMVPLVPALRIFIFLGQLYFLSLSKSVRFSEDDAYANKVEIAGNLFTYGGMCLITAVAIDPYDLLYFFTGLIICMMGSLASSGLRTKEAIYLSLLQGVCSLITLIWCDQFKARSIDVPAVDYYPITIGVFMFCFSLIGITGCALLEYMTRMLFKNREALYTYSQQAEERLHDLLAVKEQLRVDAEARARDKSKFIATAVHDLRQPIQAISNTLLPVEISLQRGDVSQAQSLLGITRKSVALMHAQLGSILDISHIETGNAKPHLQGFQLLQVLNGALDQYAEEAATRNIKLHLSKANDLAGVWVHSDFNFLMRIVCNIVHNGIKYADNSKLGGGFVSVSASTSGGVVRIDISDNGLGIDKALIEQETLFRPFFQVNNQGLHQDRGVGLGLAIVKSLVNVLPNHQLIVDSSIRHGSCFSIMLPAFDQPEERHLYPLVNTEISGNILIGYYIFIVEDDALVRQATKHLLEFHGARCEAFESCSDFFEGLAGIEREPDIILSDFNLPDGLTALDVFSTAENVFVSPNKIILTGERLDDDALGDFSDVLVLQKPVTGVSLLEAIVAVCSDESDAPKCERA